MNRANEVPGTHAPFTPIAYGRTAEIYPWNDDKVLKLFFANYDLSAVQYEWRIARAVHACGLSAPQVSEIIQSNGRNGIVFQRITGVSIMDLLLRQPWRCLHFANRMAELHARMHSLSIQADLPDMHPKLVSKIEQATTLPAGDRATVLRLLKTLPTGSQLCHGDFHPGNIMLTEQGEMMIDWVDAALGNPLADLARTTILLCGAKETSARSKPFFRFWLHFFHSAYIRRYFAIRVGGKDEYIRWLPVVAAARLNENISELQNWLVAQVKKGIEG